jgi:hypothetical protein
MAIGADVDLETVGRWEDGSEPIPDHVIRALADRYQVSIVHLMGWRNAPRSLINEGLRQGIAEDVKQRCVKLIPADCERLLKCIEWRLDAELDLPEATADAPRLQQLRTALLGYLTNPSEEQEEQHRRDEQRHREWEAWRDAESAARDAWRNAPRAAQEGMLLDALGDERLTAWELACRISQPIDPSSKGYEERREIVAYDSDLKRLAARMCKAGRLACVKEPFKSRGRFRYFRVCPLDGSIADLERAYHVEG